MTDIKILTIRDILSVNKVSVLKDFRPLTLEILGADFSGTTEVRINDLQAPEFMVLSKNRILAQVPLSQADGRLTKVLVLAGVPTPSRDSILHFEVGPTVKGITGLEKVIQQFCKLLMQSPGSDRFRPSLGGGLLDLVGKNVEKGSSQQLQVSVVNAVSRTQDQYLSLQARQRSLPASERLVSANAEAAGFDPNTTTISANVTVTVGSGKQALAGLTF